MAPIDSTTTQPSDEPAMQHAVRQQLRSLCQGALPAAEQHHAIALLCDDPIMQAYFERASEQSTSPNHRCAPAPPRRR